MSRQGPPIIRASEVGEYIYCARAWWLRRVAGLEPAGRERRSRGVVLHRRYGQTVIASRLLLLIAGLLLGVALLLILAGLF
jgi:CRISPR/Cas system-associated exonuclease Cas4 (RecB family)